jgi:arginyl-tRNA synthetase
MAEVREITAEIDKGNKAYIELWSQMVELSKVKIKEIYDKLNCTFELWNGELGSMEFVPDTMKILTPYLYPSDGALIMDVKEDDDKVEIPPLIVIKQDGATIYATRDLATIYERMKNYNPDEIWYFTDERQSMYFTQVFRAAHKSGLVNDNTILKHFGFGTVNGPDGKPFKTRDGGVMDLATLILNLKVEVDKKIKDTITGKEREEILDKLTIAALKYTDLLPYRKTDYIFDPVKFSSLDGKTGPYILYTIVRIKSLLNKAGDSNYQIKVINSQEVRDILVKLTELPKCLTASYQDASLNYICDFIYELSSLFNKFYGDHNISNEENEETKNTYIALSKLVYNTLSKLLNILAIDEVDKM